ncbi:tetratricopeptide repeat protein [Persicirhabdus sediminis]|uniref:Tetratricopeptide repeat-containing protein n=1 Tax=Persicirhabdus sediminis TaxID=454144 RepID=A0A8J7MDS6_9BACT|nr:hypothetical protein [Persicirhabdus sediminis]MBK1791127.1 hypothetical protein [Persicirhabdus sediminis]
MTEQIVEIDENALDAATKDLWLRVLSAVEINNHEFAIHLCQAVLKAAPGFLMARKMARRTAVAAGAGAKKKKGLFGGGGVSSMKINGWIKKNPLEALELIEKELESDPYDSNLNDGLFECACVLAMPETAAFALETIRTGAPENTKLLHKLAEFYLSRDEPASAADVYTTICKQDPTDSYALKGSKDATARASMKKDNWESKDSLASVKESAPGEDSAELEQGMTREQMDAKMAQLLGIYAQDQNNLKVVKQIGDLYEMMEDWANCHAYFSWAYELSNSDVALKDKADHAKDKLVAAQLDQLKQALAADPDNAELQAQYEAAQAESIEVTLREAQARVDSNPTDPHLRYELGLAFYNAGDFSAAIPHLQQATRNPHIRTKVLLLLAKTFREKGMRDLAIKQLEDALADLVAMDSTKKQVLYEKGLIHADMEDDINALGCFKEIYEVDYGYRDVAQRVEQSYS